MAVEEQINQHLDSLPEAKRRDMRSLHSAILTMYPGCKLWFFDGKDGSGKVVSNPSIGYGTLRKQYASGQTKDSFQAGISANSGGLSVYIMGLDNRTYLPKKYGKLLGKAKVSGYCIKFNTLEDIDLQVLKEAIQDGIEQTRV